MQYMSFIYVVSTKLHHLQNSEYQLQLSTTKDLAPFSGYRAFSLPGQFAPRGESTNRTLANSLPGHFAPWNFHSLQRNGPALSLTGTKVLANFRFLELSFLGNLAPIMCLTAVSLIRSIYPLVSSTDAARTCSYIFSVAGPS